MKRKLQWLLALPVTILALTGCDTGASTGGSGDDLESSGDSLAEWVDYIYSDDARLNLDYTGRTFLEDGIEEVSLKACIDGDTAHFYNQDGETIKARYYGIDTPESTGDVQEYGKGASNFNKEKLKEADENGTIVITSTSLDSYTAPSFDSTGERYVTLVWVNLETEHADPEDLVLLNLWIVQDGWSYVRNVSDIPELADIFYDAEDQAKAYKLNLFSGEPDPLFNYGDYEDTSIFDIKEEIVKSLQDPTYENIYNNQKVRIRGTVAGYSNNILYINQYDAETGEYAGVNFFTGMGSISSRYTTKNAYIEAAGLGIDDENFGFQLTDGNFNIFSSDDDAAQIILDADENEDPLTELHVAELAPDELKSEDFDYLNTPVRLTEKVKVYGGYVDGDTATLYVSDLDGNHLDYSIYIPFIYRLNNGSTAYNGTRLTTIDQFMEYEFVLDYGIYTFHKSSNNGNIYYQINLCDYLDFQPEEYLDTDTD